MTLTPKDSPADRVQALMARKEGIEAQISAQFSILEANHCTMQSPLVDPEGFPRADIDVWEVRHARVKIIELRNDLKAVMDDIFSGLQNVFDPALVSRDEPPQPAGDSGPHPWAKVDGVAPGSPAASAVSS